MKRALRIAAASIPTLLAVIFICVFSFVPGCSAGFNREPVTTTEQPEDTTPRWRLADALEPDVDYVVVSNGCALTGESIIYGDGSEYSLRGVPVTSERGALTSEVTPDMLWRFADNGDTVSEYFADGDKRLTGGAGTLMRDCYRGESYMRLFAGSADEISAVPAKKSAWLAEFKRGYWFLASPNDDTASRNLLYYSKYYGAFLYFGDYADMTQPLCAIKLYRLDSPDKTTPISSAALSVDAPVAGQAARIPEITDGEGYYVDIWSWSGEPSVFAYDSEYNLTVTLRAYAGYRFADGFTLTLNGVEAKAEAKVNGLTAVFDLAFPKTAPMDKDCGIGDTYTLMFTSDLHNATDNLARWLDNISAMGISPRTISFDGDMYTGGGGYYFTGWREYMTKVRGIIAGVFPGAEPTFTMGNHDWEYLFDTDFADIYGFSRTGVYYPGLDTGAPYAIYCIGAGAVTYGEDYSLFKDDDLAALRRFLDTVDGSGKIIFLSSHWPLHYAYNYADREVKYAERMIDLLNEYSTRNTIVFTWGHNHGNDPSMLTLRSPGDTIICDKAGTISRRISFIYANAGAMINGTGVIINVSPVTISFDYYALTDAGLDKCGSYTLNRQVKYK